METLSRLTDDQLVELYLSGSNEAFDALLHRHKDRLYSYIYYTIRNEDAANDIFQETFIKVIMTLQQGRYTATGRFYPWLTRIAHNQIIDLFRQTKSDNTLSEDDVEGDLFNNVALADPSIEMQLESAQTITDVGRLMEHLPPSQREVVFMRFYQDMSFKEIAEATNVGINTALGRMRYALLNMRRLADEHRISLTYNS